MQRRGLVASRSVVVAVGATVMTDTLALLVLAVVSGAVGQQPADHPALGLLTLGSSPCSSCRDWRGGGSPPGAVPGGSFVFVFLAFLAAALARRGLRTRGDRRRLLRRSGPEPQRPQRLAADGGHGFVGNSLSSLLPDLHRFVDRPSVMFQPATLVVAAAFALAVISGNSTWRR